MQPKLVVISGPDRGRAFPLAEGQTLIVGRGESAATHLTDPHVSRTHCQVQAGDGRFHLTDLGGRSGTLVNGQPTTGCDLKPGDVIRIGGTELRFQREGSTDAATVVGPPPAKPQPTPAAASLTDLVGKKLASFEI